METPIDPKVPPSKMHLECPKCGTTHIDEGEWATRPHKTHQCQNCKHEWRPFPYPTVGVCDPHPDRKWCPICGWRKGGKDSWNGKACKCGYTHPSIKSNPFDYASETSEQETSVQKAGGDIRAAERPSADSASVESRTPATPCMKPEEEKRG